MALLLEVLSTEVLQMQGHTNLILALGAVLLLLAVQRSSGSPRVFEDWSQSSAAAAAASNSARRSYDSAYRDRVADIKAPDALTQFINYVEKSQLSADKQQNLYALLHEAQAIEMAQSRLLAEDVRTVDASESLQRSHALRYLLAALAWQENPAREQVLSAIKTCLLYDNLSGISMDLARSFTEDKIGLFRAISLVSREEANKVMKAGQEGPLAKVFVLAKKLSDEDADKPEVRGGAGVEWLYAVLTQIDS